MASVAEQMASNISLANFAKATELKKRIWFTLGALILFRLLSYVPMPGNGTNESSRKTTSAPSVNHSLFLRSVALAKFAKLRLAAICSAADAISECSPTRCQSYRTLNRHCEERSDEAIQWAEAQHWVASLRSQ